MVSDVMKIDRPTTTTTTKATKHKNGIVDVTITQPPSKSQKKDYNSVAVFFFYYYSVAFFCVVYSLFICLMSVQSIFNFGQSILRVSTTQRKADSSTHKKTTQTKIMKINAQKTSRNYIENFFAQHIFWQAKIWSTKLISQYNGFDVIHKQIYRKKYVARAEKEIKCCMRGRQRESERESVERQ